MQISIIERSQWKGVKLNMRGRKLRSGIYWRGELKHKGEKQVVCITRAICTYTWSIFHFCQVGGEIEANNKQYAEEQDNVTKAVEDSYLKAKSDKSFLFHVLQVRLSRLRDLASTRLEALEASLRSDRRLSVLYC